MTHHVLIAGGGVAALEAHIVLRDLAGDRVRVTGGRAAGRVRPRAARAPMIIA
jgi:hypothetical protein